MNLAPDETVLRSYRRHKTPYVFKILKITLLMTPIFVMVAFLYPVLSMWIWALVLFIAILSCGFFVVHMSLLYWMDQFIITDRRIVFVNWISLFRREEYQAELGQIEDIKTREHGLFSRLKIFDFGWIKIETASSNTTLFFENAPDPEGIKDFLYKSRAKNDTVLT